MVLGNIKKIKGKKKIAWNHGRFRGLEEAKERIGDLTQEVNQLLKLKNKINILEIGCGYGKILLELKKIYGDKIETYGINLEPKWSSKLVRKFGIAEKIFTRHEIDKNLPKIVIGDAGKKIDFPSSYFDLIFAQASIQYVPDKSKLIEEVNRVLTKNGRAIIELQEVKSKPTIEYKNLFEIWDNGKKVNCISYLRKFKNIGAKKTKVPGWDCHVLTIKKSKRFNLQLKLINSVDINQINKKWWGTKAVYVRR